MAKATTKTQRHATPCSCECRTGRTRPLNCKHQYPCRIFAFAALCEGSVLHSAGRSTRTSSYPVRKDCCDKVRCSFVKLSRRCQVSCSRLESLCLALMPASLRSPFAPFIISLPGDCFTDLLFVLVKTMTEGTWCGDAG
jgi:hypothetical protein